MPSVLITGASRGIGHAAAKAFAEAGWDLLLVSRSDAALQSLQSELSALGIRVVHQAIDLTDSTAIAPGIETLLSQGLRPSVLINNAGVYLAKRIETVDGYEQTFAVNHMAYFLVCRGLLDLLKAANNARVVNVSSFGHRLGSTHLDDYNFERRRYSPMMAYCASKLMNIQFTRHLASRLEDDGITVNCLHPGMVRSGFAVSQKDAFALLTRMSGVFLVSPERGARTSIHLASSPDVAAITGAYFRGLKAVKPSRNARDPEQAAALWTLSESLIKYDSNSSPSV